MSDELKKCPFCEDFLLPFGREKRNGEIVENFIHSQGFEDALVEWANLSDDDVGLGGAFARELLSTRAELAELREQVRWIPVGERLPEIGQGVIGRHELCEPCYVTYSGHNTWYLNEYAAEEWDINKPTHWMALPAAIAELERKVHGQAKIKNKLAMTNARTMYDMRVRDGETQSFESWLLGELSTCAFQRDALAKELAEANEDAERLANKLQEYADCDDSAQLENGGTFTEPYKFIGDVMELHRARLAALCEAIAE